MQSLHNTIFTSDVESVSKGTYNKDEDSSSPLTSSEQDWIPENWIEKGIYILQLKCLYKYCMEYINARVQQPHTARGRILKAVHGYA